MTLRLGHCAYFIDRIDVWLSATPWMDPDCSGARWNERIPITRVL